MHTMQLRKIFFLLAVICSLTYPVIATITISVTAPSSVTQGSSVSVSASFTASEGDSGTFYLTCDQTVSGEVDPESGYSVMSSTSKTYTFTPGTAQTYSNCKVTDGGTQSSSPFSINVVAPSTLTVSGSPSETINSSGDTFSLEISITNPTASAITTSYSLDCPSGYTCTGDQESDTIEIGAVSTTTLEWTVTVGDSSSDINFQLGSNSDAFTCSVTIPSTTTTTSPGGGSPGSSGELIIGAGVTTTTRTPVKEVTPEIVEPGSQATTTTFISRTGKIVAEKNSSFIVPFIAVLTIILITAIYRLSVDFNRKKLVKDSSVKSETKSSDEKQKDSKKK